MAVKVEAKRKTRAQATRETRSSTASPGMRWPSPTNTDWFTIALNVNS